MLTWPFPPLKLTQLLKFLRSRLFWSSLAPLPQFSSFWSSLAQENGIVSKPRNRRSYLTPGRQYLMPALSQHPEHVLQQAEECLHALKAATTAASFTASYALICTVAINMVCCCKTRHISRNALLPRLQLNILYHSKPYCHYT